MLKQFSFTYKIIATLLVILVLVSVTGIYAYQQFSSIVKSLSDDTRPDMLLVTSKALMNDIIDAENNAKSFSLTKDTLYLDQFYEEAEQVDENLTKFHTLGDKMYLNTNRLDSLDTLITHKFKILNELLLIQDQFRVQTALDKVVNKIDKAINKDETKTNATKPKKQKTTDNNKQKELPTANETSNKKRKGIFGWLFKKQNKKKGKVQESKPIIAEEKNDSTKTSLTKDNLNEDIKFSKINTEVQKVKKEEKYIETILKDKELELIIVDKEVTKKIQTLLDDIEAAELLLIDQKSKDSRIALKNSNQQIAIFCIAIGILLMFMAYVIINYVRNNNKYRKALKRAKAKAEDLATTKEKFLANMSHEIRTPMNAISGFTEQLAQTKLNKEQKEQLTMIRKSVEHLLYLINDVLDYTKLQAGKLKLEKIGFNLKNVVEDVITFTKPLAKEKELEIKCEIQTNNDLILIGDPYRLRQILLNLISNAIKFTPKGSIIIKVNSFMQNNRSMHLRFEVIDTGIGMNQQFLKKVFKEFEQAEESTTRNYGGTGLGLSIVRMLVKLHKGKVDLKSEPKVGTSVIFEIPYRIGTQKDLKCIEENKTQLTLPQNLKVLIVDDEAYNRKLLIAILKKYQAFYTEAENGKEALTEIEHNDYDLILMDARMPEMNGLEASKKIRQIPDQNRSTTPIIALTAAITKEDRLAYQKAGMNGFVAKPFKEEELLYEISKVLSNHPETNNQTIQKSSNEESKIDFTDLKNLSGNDDKFYIDMLQTFMDTTQDAFNEIENAIKVDDWDMVAEYAHKASSPCKHLSANTLYQHLKTIEKNCRDGSNIDYVPGILKQAKKEFKIIKVEVQEELKKIKTKAK